MHRNDDLDSDVALSVLVLFCCLTLSSIPTTPPVPTAHHTPTSAATLCRAKQQQWGQWVVVPRQVQQCKARSRYHPQRTRVSQGASYCVKDVKDI